MDAAASTVVVKLQIANALQAGGAKNELAKVPARLVCGTLKAFTEFPFHRRYATEHSNNPFVPCGNGRNAASRRAQQVSRGQASPSDQNLDAAKVRGRADSWLSAYEKAGDFSGVVLLAQGDQVLFEKAYGYADAQVRSPNRPDTRFRVASLNKTLTAAAIEQLVNQGKLRYSDPLSRYITGIPNGDSITIEQLLTHQSGIGVLDSEDIYRDCISHDDLLRRLADAKPLFAPGKESAYSNEGYFLLAAVIERASGSSYEALLRQNTFAPLGMGIPGLLAAISRLDAMPSAT